MIQKFKDRFGEPPKRIVRAPGRVNLIGEHTDYNEGFVLPMTIDRAAWIALRPREDGVVRARSVDFNQTAEFEPVDLSHEGADWAEYMKGMAWALQEAGFTLRGWDGVVAGDVPIGAGLSSSAALELAIARAFAEVSGFEWDAPTMAKLAQHAENHWVGVRCGIMDQMISAAGKAGHALLIDCRSLETEFVPLPPDTAVVILDTSTRRGLVDSVYNERRDQCEMAARFFNVQALRDVDLPTFEAQAAGLTDIIRRRARHVITENARTLQARDAMRAGDAALLGQLMNASHTSLRDDYEVSSAALNAIVECAQAHEACYGARMTGAGFGGCAVALVREADAEDFVGYASIEYEQRTAFTPSIYICKPTNGAEVITLDAAV